MAVLRWGLALLLVALLVPAPSAVAASSGIVATMSNSATANKVLLWSRASDGSLTFIGRTKTGGKGSGGALGNQGGLALSADGNWLHVVNSASDTVTVFRASGTTRTRTEVETWRGDKPISVTVNGSLLYVLNAGGNGTSRGFRRDTNGQLTRISGSRRTLSGSATKPAQIGFNPGGNYVF